MSGWFSNVTSGLISGVAAGVVLLVGAGLFAEAISDVAGNANPSCASPRGLKPIDKASLSVEAGSVHAPTRSASYGAAAAIDGYGGSIWVPLLDPDKQNHPLPTFNLQNDHNVLTLSLSSAHDVKLVCVVNGLANTYTNYSNWGRVRTIEVSRPDDVIATTVLQSLGPDAFPNSQLAARNLGSTKTVRLRLLDAYAGLTVESYDPDVCLADAATDVREGSPVAAGVQPRYERGCLINPTPMAGLADVYLYEAS